MAVKLIWWGLSLEEMRKAGQQGKHMHPVDVGCDPYIVEGTGRATCRCCGEKIKKGEKAIFFYWDFAQCGSWTAVGCQVHLDDCQSRFGKEETA